jgi:hypothetical protein
MSQCTQEDLVFLDESIFNEKSGWRHKGTVQLVIKVGTLKIFREAQHGLLLWDKGKEYIQLVVP